MANHADRLPVSSRFRTSVCNSAQVSFEEEPSDSFTSIEETADPEAASGPGEILSLAAVRPSLRSLFQFSPVDSRSSASATTEFVRQTSQRLYGSATEFGSARFSGVRTLTFEELEKGASRYYRQNSVSFGQVVPVVDDDVLEQYVLNGQEREETEEKLALESSQETALEKTISAHLQDLPTIAGENQKQRSLKTKGLSDGRKSRLGTIILEQSWFTVYKRLYFVTFTLNTVGLILATTGHFTYAKSRAVLFSLGNIFMCVLMRSEVFLRVLFWLAVHLLGYRWVPVQLKTMMTALLQSVGGIHSGCGLGAVVWLVYALEQSIQNKHTVSNIILGAGFGILLLLLLSSLAAFPVFRHIHHNFFERVHRLAGWSSLGLVWAYVVLSTFWHPATQSYKVSSYTRKQLIEMESLWLTVATTVVIILPWLSVRRVAVETVVPPSKLNSLLHFEGGVGAGYLARISPSPFSEWHAFGIISDGHTRKTILAGAVGDFTKSLVENPPTHIWMRSLHFAGLPYLTNMYQKALLVATGSGICVFLSFLLQPSKADVHIIWIAKKIQESYGDKIWKTVNEMSNEEKLTLIDTAVSGRPNTRQLVMTKAKEWRAEVVIVTSNPTGTNEIVNGCKAVGMPAFGPIWDS